MRKRIVTINKEINKYFNESNFDIQNWIDIRQLGANDCLEVWLDGVTLFAEIRNGIYEMCEILP